MAKLTLIRFSLLSLSTYNKKKLINILNIGIFISLFALSASILSIFFETKIDKIEKKMIYDDINKVVYNDVLFQTSRYIKNTDSLLDDIFHQTSLKLLLEKSISDKLLISKREIFYTQFFLLKTKVEYNKNFIDSALKNSIIVADQEDDLILIKKFRDKYDDLLKKIDEINFDRNTHDYEKQPPRDKNNNYNETNHSLEEWYSYYEILIKRQIDILIFQKTFFYDFNIEFFTKKNNQYEERKKLNLEKIKKNSLLESRTIFFAFLIQLIIFIITQFFELTLDNLISRKKNAKRK